MDWEQLKAPLTAFFEEQIQFTVHLGMVEDMERGACTLPCPSAIT